MKIPRAKAQGIGMITIFLFLGRRFRLHTLRTKPSRVYLLSSAAVTHIYYHSKLRKSSDF